LGLGRDTFPLSEGRDGLLFDGQFVFSQLMDFLRTLTQRATSFHPARTAWENRVNLLGTRPASEIAIFPKIVAKLDSMTNQIKRRSVHRSLQQRPY
jgi:hypothetical protein